MRGKVSQLTHCQQLTNMRQSTEIVRGSDRVHDAFPVRSWPHLTIDHGAQAEPNMHRTHDKTQ